MRMKITALLVLGLFVSMAAQSLSTAEVKRIQEAAAVIADMMGVPDKDIPRSLWNSAKCVAVIPGLKRAAFVIGGEYGKGLVSCRTASGEWSPPVFITMQKGSWGFQVGAEEVDLVLLVMNQRGIDHLLQNKFTLGTEASVAAGPLGRDVQAATDLQMRAEMLSWSRSRGIFAGINLAGGIIKADDEDNNNLYGRPMAAREVLLEAKAPVPAVAVPFIEALKAHDKASATSAQD